VKAVCAWCRAEGRPGLIGERPPFGDPAEVRGICWAHKLEVLARTRTSSGAATSPPRDAHVRFLVIVARRDSDLFHRVSEQFLDDPRVRVLLDRRHRERRQGGQPSGRERRRADRRRSADYWEDTRYHPVVIVPVQKTTDASRVLQTPRRQSVPEVTPMDFDALMQARRQLDQWTRDGQDILSTVIPSLFQECEGLRRRAESAEAHSARLGLEIEDLQSEITRLRAEIDRQKLEASAAVDTVDKGLSEIGRITTEVLLKLKGR
jgi:hypothetical protein